MSNRESAPPFLSELRQLRQQFQQSRVREQALLEERDSLLAIEQSLTQEKSELKQCLSQLEFEVARLQLSLKLAQLELKADLPRVVHSEQRSQLDYEQIYRRVQSLEAQLDETVGAKDVQIKGLRLRVQGLASELETGLNSRQKQLKQEQRVSRLLVQQVEKLRQQNSQLKKRLSQMEQEGLKTNSMIQQEITKAINQATAHSLAQRVLLQRIQSLERTNVSYQYKLSCLHRQVVRLKEVQQEARIRQRVEPSATVIAPPQPYLQVARPTGKTVKRKRT